MTNKTIKKKMKTFIKRYTKKKISDDLNLFTTGMISSLTAVEMITYIEREFGVTVENKDLDLVNFQSLNAIAEFVTRKQDEN